MSAEKTTESQEPNPDQETDQQNPASPSQDAENQHKENDPLSELKELSQDELLEKFKELSSKFEEANKQVHKANSESKERKLKLRQLEKDKEAEQTRLLEEQNKYKELYEGLKTKTEGFDSLVAFKEAQEEKFRQRVDNLKNKLSAAEADELAIFGDSLSDEKKIEWMELKINTRQSFTPDTTKAGVSGGTNKKQPQNRRELSKLSNEDYKDFKARFPVAFKEAMKNP